MRFLYIIECILICFSYLYPSDHKGEELLSIKSRETCIDYFIGWIGLAITIGIIFIIGYNIRREKNAKMVTIVGLIICIAFFIVQIILVETRFHQLGL